MRVASLIPSSTEIVAALGLEETLVARSHECDHPAGVRALPAVTAASLDPEASSAAIDQDVKSLLEKGLSIYHVDGETLRGLRPDVILTQAQCEVCAVTPAQVEAVLGSGWDPTPRLVTLSPNTLADVWADIQAVADALGHPAYGERLLAELQGRVEAVAARAAELPRRRVALVEWIDPLMGAGNWMPELATLAGGESVLGRPGEHSGYASLDDLAAADPDVVVVLPCGFDLPRTRAELPALADQPAWQALRAVEAGQVALTDGNAFFNRPGPRLVESLEILAEILHPEAFDFGHRGAAWEPA